MVGEKSGIVILLALALSLMAGGTLRAQEVPAVPTRGDFIGAWVAKDFDPVIYISSEAGTENGKVLHQKMLLFIEPVEDAEHLVRCTFYEWNDDYSTVLGPEYGIGIHDPTDGTLVLGGPAQGLNPVKLLPGRKLQYVHAKAMADNSWMSVRYLWPLDEDAARKLGATLEKKKP